MDEILKWRAVDPMLENDAKLAEATIQRAIHRLARAHEPPHAEDLFHVDFAPNQLRGQPQSFIDDPDIDPGEHVYLISLDRRPTKRLRGLQELQKAQLRAFIFEAIDGDAIRSQKDSK